MTDFFGGRLLVKAVFGLTLAGVGVGLALHHPLGGIIASIVFVGIFALGLARFPFWLIIVPAVMPVIGLAPWSGWLSFEEFDLLVLALAGGGYLRLALSDKEDMQRRTGKRMSSSAALLLVGFALSVVASMFRGFEDAGGFTFGWYQGYYEPMNSIRLAKSFFLALCLLPLWLRCCRNDQDRAVNLLALGMAIGLGLASLAAVWERVAFTGLLNFSADYRTTALFWEMHVGGAAFDGFLALTVPFAVWALVHARTPGRVIFFGGILLLAAYACLTTFSRGVYLAIPVGLALMAILSARHAGTRMNKLGGAMVFSALLIVALFGVAAFLIFPTSGYRGLLALAISVALFYPVSVFWGRAQGKIAWLALMAGVTVTCVATVAGYLLPKGAYLVFVFGALLTALALWKGRGGLSASMLSITLAGYLSMLAGCVSIAFHWGGGQAVNGMGLACLALAIAMLAVRVRPLPVRSVRWHISLVSAMLVVSLSVATFSGGRYMNERFSTSGHDLESRMQHWSDGLAQLDTFDWLLGKGLGRFPASYFFAAPAAEHPGGYRHIESGGESYLLLSGGQHVNGWGEIFRVTQRVSPGLGPYTVQFAAWAEKDVRLHFEICEKHLLYNAACVMNEISVKPTPDGWQKLELKLAGSPPARGAWYAPSLVAFSVAMESLGGLIKLDNLALLDSTGSDLLANGDFGEGLAHWFSSSDKHHMPWHMKSLFFHILFEQGGLGLGLLSLMILAVFWRLTMGSNRQHPLAPVVVGSLAGFLVVGVFDSLLDVPRLASLFYWVLMIGLFVHAKVGHRPVIRKSSKHFELASQGT